MKNEITDIKLPKLKPDDWYYDEEGLLHFHDLDLDFMVKAELYLYYLETGSYAG